jgi:RHH-type proline utilization regulon transcriptional repressor/proline dehydrogenase/delta 1-pyrroline-5-carboxylate dehydrogenase
MSTTISPALNQRIIQFGTGVFADLEDTEPSPFDMRYWNGRLMQWSMSQPEFKVNLFRLVDVLPNLRTPEAIGEHVRQYLTEPAERMHPSLAWLIGLSDSTIGRALTAFFVKQGVHQMASLFIAGSDPKSALKTLKRLRRDGFCFTVDLLGEFCVCEREAREYQRRYLDALETFGATIPNSREGRPLMEGHPGELSPVCISVKLSALYSQTSTLNFERSIAVLSERLSEIARRAKAIGALVYVDAEDSGNNVIIYETFKRVFSSPEFIDMPYPGIVVQAYSRKAEERTLDLLNFARRRGSPIAIRLVKGAYWDFERVVSKQNDWDFPLWTEKESSDACFEHLSRLLLDNRDVCLPAFGSHNIRSLSHACCYAEHKGLSPKDFEIQVLYGMAEPIAAAFSSRGYLTRMYVPLGDLVPGMGYLVRRLLENTSNESFLRHTFFDAEEVSTLLKEPRFPGSIDLTETISPPRELPEAQGDGIVVQLDY